MVQSKTKILTLTVSESCLLKYIMISWFKIGLLRLRSV